jgi:hypothetical protein
MRAGTKRSLYTRNTREEFMFIKDTDFKRLLKKAYKGAGLLVGRTDDDILTVSGYSWTLEVKRTNFDRALLGELIKFIGEIPEKGMSVQYRDGEDPQITVGETVYKGLSNKYIEEAETFQPGRVVIQTENIPSVVYQGLTERSHILVPEKISEIISYDQKKGELAPEYPKIYDKELIWTNYEHYFSCYIQFIRYLGEQQFMDAIRGHDVCWTCLVKDLV